MKLLYILPILVMLFSIGCSAGSLSITDYYPTELIVAPNTNFDVNVSISCSGGDCGVVIAGLYYNYSESYPDLHANDPLGSSLFLTNSTYESWVDDGLSGGYSIFQMGTPTFTTYLNDQPSIINGNELGEFYGWSWTGTAWVSNSSLVSGLADIGARSRPTIEYINGVLTLISGETSGLFYGYTWTGSSWVSNASVIVGLTNTGAKSSPYMTTFNGLMTLISGDESAPSWAGYTWNNTSWISNSSVIAGLVSWGYSSPTFWEDRNGIWNLLTSRSVEIIFGYTWNGNSWVSNTSNSERLTIYGPYNVVAVGELKGVPVAIIGSATTAGVFAGDVMLVNEQFAPLAEDENISFIWQVNTSAESSSSYLLNFSVYSNDSGVSYISSPNFLINVFDFINISLISPANASENNELTQIFEYIPYAYLPIDNCSFVKTINEVWTIQETDSSIDINSSNYFSYTADDDETFYWYVNCSIGTNALNSESWIYTMLNPETLRGTTGLVVSAIIPVLFVGWLALGFGLATGVLETSIAGITAMFGGGFLLVILSTLIYGFL